MLVMRTRDGLGANPRTGFRQVSPGAYAIRSVERWYEKGRWYMGGTYRKYDEEKQVNGETRSDPDWYPLCRRRRITRRVTNGKRSSRPGSAGNLVNTTKEEQ